MQSLNMSITKYNDICPSVRLISVTTEPIEFYSSGFIPIGPVVVLSHFLGGWDTHNPQKNKKIPLPFFLFLGSSFKISGRSRNT